MNQNQQQRQLPIIGGETAVHYLIQLEAKLVTDAQKLAILTKVLEDLKGLKNEDVDKILEKHGISLQA
jgi:hypothetical protein